MNQEKTYRVAILGAGFIGKVHAYAYATLPFYSSPLPLRAEVKWVAAAHPETAEAVAAMLPAAAGTADWRRAVEDDEVDIVHVCTPNYLHREQLEAAIRAGKHIYCEKPLCATRDEAESLAALLADYRGVSHMTFHHRYFASVELARDLIAQGKLGRILEFRGAYLQDSHVDENRPIRWKNERAAGGGALADIGSHLIDLADWLVGPMRCVASVSSTPFGDASRAEDAVSMIWQTSSNSAVGTLQVSKIALGHENDLSLTIYGTAGALRIHCMTPHYLEFCDARPLTHSGPHPVTGWTRLAVGHRYSPPDTTFPATKSAIGWTRAHCACLADFLRAVAEGKNSAKEIDLQRGIYIQRLMDGVKM